MQPHTKIDKEEFLNLIRFCVHECSIIAYNNELYRQLDGLQMGSPLAPILSDILMDHLFDTLLPQFPVVPDFLFKYVDDTICSLPPHATQDFLNLINSYHPRIKFTIELENNNQIPFLDLVIIKQPDLYLATNWYSKPTSAQTILNYLSAHPHYQKINVASNLTKRILQLSDKQFHSENLEKISNILTKNNYPRHIINNIIHKTVNHLRYNTQTTFSINSNQSHHQAQHQVITDHSSLFSQQHPSHTLTIQPDNRQNNLVSETSVVSTSQPHNQQENQQVNTNQPTIFFTSLTYIPHLSDKIRHLIKNKNPDTKIAFKSTKTLKSNILHNTKQKLHKLQQSGVVYKIDCAEGTCPVSYLGETQRQLGTRISEHERDYRNRLIPSPKTALVNHCLETGHQFNFDDITILDREKNVTKRRVIESSHILLNKPYSCNFKTDTNNLNNNYMHTLKTYKSISPKFKKKPANNNTSTTPHSTDNHQ